MLLSSFSSDAFKIAGAYDVDVTNVGNNQEVDVGEAALMISAGSYRRSMSDMLANAGRTLTQG